MVSLRPRAAVGACAVAVVLAAGGCSDGGDGGASSDESTEETGGGPGPARVPSASVPEVPPASGVGLGLVVVGGTTSSFAVTACRLEPDPAAPSGARALVELEGAGTTGSGVPFTIELQRFATGTDVVTYTDTLTYSDAARILQAQRVEVAGQVTDLRDPDATTALVRPRADGVVAAGLAGGPGDVGADDGIIGLALNASC